MLSWKKNIFWFLVGRLCGSLPFTNWLRQRIDLDAKEGYPPSTPPYFTYAAPFLLNRYCRRRSSDVERFARGPGAKLRRCRTAADHGAIATRRTWPAANSSSSPAPCTASLSDRRPTGDQKRRRLKGKCVGISRFGSSSEWIIRLGFAKLGLDADRRFCDDPNRWAGRSFMAMQSNTIEATLLAPPPTIMAVQKAGMKELLDVPSWTFLSAGKRDDDPTFLQSNRPLLKRS